MASEKGLGWDTGTFLRIFKANRDAAKEISLDDCPVISALQRWLVQAKWNGTMTELLKELDKSKLAQEARHPEWPKSPNMLSGILKRFESSLEQVKLQIIHNKRTKLEGRTITIQRLP